MTGRGARGTAAGDEGFWTLVPDRDVAPGVYNLRLDQVSPDGRVVARVEFPFSRTESPPVMEDESTVVVQPGNSLWRLARRASDEFEGVHGREGEPEMGAEQGAARPAGGETAFGPRACLHPRP